MTISPPANVRLGEDEPARVLACGLDTLYLAVDLNWGGQSFFEYLRGLKNQAAEAETPQPGENWTDDGEEPWQFTVQPFGKNGYEWLLSGREFRVDLGSWQKPRSRPSAMAYIGSETLWLQGPRAVVGRILRQFEAAGGSVQVVKTSRVDLCVDVLLRESDWHIGLCDCFSTRAGDDAAYRHRRKLTGFKVGSSGIVARLYDKPAEIAKKGRKGWMYDVWGIPSLPEGHRVIRVEFQLRREAIKELKTSTFEDLMREQGRVWAYCTQKWLTLKDHPERHASRRKVLPWWRIVQDGFTESQGAQPLVREKAIRADREQLLRQMFGNLTSLMGLEDQGRTLHKEGMYTLVAQLPKLMRAAEQLGLSDEELTERVLGKLAKYRRHEAIAPAGRGAAASDAVSSDLSI